MLIREVTPQEKEAFNAVVVHPLQSWEWGEFREKTKIKVARFGYFDKTALKSGFQITFHQIPKTNFTIGYLPKCIMPDKMMLEALTNIAKENNCIFFKLEPSVKINPDNKQSKFLLDNGCFYGKPLFTKYTFELDLRPDETTLLANMKPKTRYNVRIAQKNEVKVFEDNSQEAFNKYLELTFTTTKRQRFYAHDENYHKLMWQTLLPSGMAHLLKATYQNQILVTWIVFIFNNILYYPYGASSREFKDVMASNLMMWEAIRFGKLMNCHTFDLWGSLGPNPDPKDPWFGFHRFKEGYGANLVEFIGTFDYIINLPMYRFYSLADNLRWKWLKFKSSLPF